MSISKAWKSKEAPPELNFLNLFIPTSFDDDKLRFSGCGGFTGTSSLFPVSPPSGGGGSSRGGGGCEDGGGRDKDKGEGR